MIRVFYFLIFCFCSLSANAYDESWISVMAKKFVSSRSYLTIDFVRRDTGSPFSEYFRNLYRGSYGYRLDSWQFVVGLAYADFANSENEYRFFQQAIYGFKWNFLGSKGLLRSGLEQRHLEGDERLYWRTRFKILLEPYREKSFGPSFYNESFFGLTEGHRFKYGYNENRLAVGLRAKILQIETTFYGVHANVVRSSGKEKQVDWLQFQLNFDLDSIGY